MKFNHAASPIFHFAESLLHLPDFNFAASPFASTRFSILPRSLFHLPDFHFGPSPFASNNFKWHISSYNLYVTYLYVRVFRAKNGRPPPEWPFFLPEIFLWMCTLTLFQICLFSSNNMKSIWTIFCFFVFNVVCILIIHLS